MSTAAVEPAGQRCVFMVRNTEVAVAPKVRKKSPMTLPTNAITSAQFRAQPMKLTETFQYVHHTFAIVVLIRKQRPIQNCLV